jgi:Glycosyltransferase family 87
VLGALVLVAVPTLGSQPWPFRPDEVDPRGPLGPLVRAAGEEWDLGLIRSAAMLGAVLVAVAAASAWRALAWPRWAAAALTLAVVGLLTVPATLLQVGLRDATEPWLHVNDSTYQIELAGDLILDGENPYGHDYRGSGLERFYEEARFDDDLPQVALDHFAYFPGTPLSAAAWRLLPSPFDDYRLFVLLTTLAAVGAVVLIRAPFAWRLAAGAAVAANPLALRGAWFGTADLPSILLLVLSLAFVTRSRYGVAAACLGGAVLMKQFALVALPFLALMVLHRGAGRRTLRDAAAVFAAVVAAGVLPFAVAAPGALWDDTIAYGADTYRIVGYGLSGLLVGLGVIDDRFDPYPFLPLVLVVWAPLTAWLLLCQWRARTLWAGAAGFAVSIFVLLFLGRVLQTSYLLWPLAGIVLAALLARSGEPDAADV